MSFLFRSRDTTVELRKYMQNCRLPPLLCDQDDDGMPAEGQITQGNYLSIQPEIYRRLESMYCLDDDILGCLKSWLDTSIPSEPLQVVEPDPYNGEHLAIPNPIPRGHSCNLVQRPEDMRRFLPWLDRLPLITVQRIVHLAFPETKDWAFRTQTPSPQFREPDREIWSEYLWSLKKPRNSPEMTEKEKSQRVVIAVQPPWILTENDLYSFIFSLSFTQLIIPGEPFPETEHRLWGKIWDSCVRNGTRYFVLTSYSHWVFGIFSPGWTIGFTTSVIKGTQNDPSIVELLSFWIASAMRLPGGFIAPKLPEPFYSEPPQLFAPRQPHECSFPEDSQSEWELDSSDVASSAGVAPSLYTATDGGVPGGKGIYAPPKDDKNHLIDDWIQRGEEEGLCNIEIEENPPVDFQVNGLPFVVEVSCNQHTMPNNQWVGQWMTT